MVQVGRGYVRRIERYRRAGYLLARIEASVWRRQRIDKRKPLEKRGGSGQKGSLFQRLNRWRWFAASLDPSGGSRAHTPVGIEETVPQIPTHSHHHSPNDVVMSYLLGCHE